jgi:hypothetical protein
MHGEYAKGVALDPGSRTPKNGSVTGTQRASICPLIVDGATERGSRDFAAAP